jgi:hypothetical protein
MADVGASKEHVGISESEWVGSLKKGTPIETQKTGISRFFHDAIASN